MTSLLIRRRRGRGLKLADFLRIAEYTNENWAKGSFTPEEVKQNSDIYYSDFLWSKWNDEIAESIKSLCKNLAEDAREMPDLIAPRQWLYQITNELGMFDIGCQDYIKTDEWLKEILKDVETRKYIVK